MRRITLKNPQSQSKLLRIQELLRQNPMTAKELASSMHISANYVYAYTTLLKESKSIYVLRWDRANRYQQLPVAVYAWADTPTEDAPAPKDAVKEVYVEPKVRAKVHLSRPAPKRDPLVAAFFGV